MEIFIEKNRKIIIGGVFSLAIFLILFHFTDTPRVWVDEGIFTNIAENLSLHGVYGLQAEQDSFFRSATLFTTNYPVIFPVALSFKIFGIGIWQARLPMVVYMFLLSVVFYFFIKKRYGLYPALAGVFLLISFAPFYGNGRPVQGEVPGLFFLILGSLFLLYLEESNFESRKFAILSGLFLGLAAVTKTLYLLLIFVALPLTILFWIKKINNKRNILILLGVFLIPVILLFRINYPTMELAKEIIPTIIHQSGNNGASSMSDTSLPLITIVFTNVIRFVKESTPILFLFLAMTVFYAFIRRYLKKGDWDLSITDYFLLSIVVLNWGGYLLGTGWYRYFFPAQVVLYLLFPGAILFLIRATNKEINKKLYLVASVILVLFQFYHFLFLSDTSFLNINANNDEVSKILSVIPSDKKVLFHNSIESIVFLKGGNYSQYVMLPGLFEVGDTDWFSGTSNDFIFIGSDNEILNKISPCYAKTQIGKHYLFKKTDGCSK